MKIGVYVTSLVDPSWIPERAHLTDVGFDIKTAIDFNVGPGQNVKVPTGLVFDLPTWEYLLGEVPCRLALIIEQRTGNAGRGLFPAATVVDAGYRPDPKDKNGLVLSLRNVNSPAWFGRNTLAFKRGDKVMQGRFVLHPIPELIAVSTKEVTWDTDRGPKRFGQTGR